MDTVYIETSIISYLRQKPSSQVVAADRLQALDAIPLLPHDTEIPRIAAEIMAIGVLPEELLGDDTEND